MAAPRSPLSHDTVAQALDAARPAAWTALWQILLKPRPDVLEALLQDADPPAPAPRPDDDASTDEAA